MNKKVAVIGAADASPKEKSLAREAGKLIASNGWTLVCGGLGGVMEEACKGAKEAGGLTIGILPGPDARQSSAFVDVAIATNMGHARNMIIAHTADCVIAIGGKEGTMSELAIASKLGKPVASLFSFDAFGAKVVGSAADAIAFCKHALGT